MSGVGGEAPRRQVTLRQELKVFTRQKLIDAALRCFADEGYINTTIDDIVTGAGTTRTSFYQHFRNKADVLTEVVHDITRGTAFSMLKEEGLCRSYEGVRRWATLTLEYWRRVRVREGIFRQALESEPELASLRASEIARYLKITEEVLAATGRPPGEQLRIEAMMLFAQLNRFFDLWSEEEDHLDDELVVSVMADMLWRQLRPETKQRARRPVSSTAGRTGGAKKAAATTAAQRSQRP